MTATFDQPRKVRDAAEFGRVAVLLGGDSAEREVSLASGAQVLAGLQRAGIDAHGVDKGADLIERLQRERFDRAFIILHGRGGEDGTVQGALETIGMPYTGSGVLGSALAMDKHRTKLVWRALGIATPEFRIVGDERALRAAGEALGFPLAVKPVHEGSSIGIGRADDDESLHRAWFEASGFDAEVLVEPWLDGVEYTAAVLLGRSLPLIRLETPREFYDYAAKYADDAGTRYICPCGLPAEREAEIAAEALAAFDAVGASGWGRVDFICTEGDRPQFLDVNTAPGMTSHSLVPMAAQAVGLDFDELVWRFLETSL